MVSNIYLLLGLSQDAPWPEVSRAYARLMESLSKDDQCSRSGVMRRLQAARERLSESFETVKQAEGEDAPSQASTSTATYCRPKIGQVLVAAGLLSLEELDAALEIQRNTKTEHVPLGELLVATGYITQRQLDYYLRQQQLFQLPPDHPQRWGQRLVELGMVSEDQLKVALIEQKTTCCTLRQALINRGWLSAQELDRIF